MVRVVLFSVFSVLLVLLLFAPYFGLADLRLFLLLLASDVALLVFLQIGLEAGKVTPLLRRITLLLFITSTLLTLTVPFLRDDSLRLLVYFALTVLLIAGAFTTKAKRYQYPKP